MAGEKASKSGKGVAIAKRVKIDKAQQNMLVAVCVASIILGVTLVLVAYFARVISFNMKIISAQDEAIDAYKTTQANLYRIKEDIEDLSSNENLESVARTRNKNCLSFDENLEKNEENKMITEYEPEMLDLARQCTALRVITDALPSLKNTETTMTSFVYLLENPVSGTGAVVEGSGYDESIGQVTIGGVPLNAYSLNASYSAFSIKDMVNALESMDSSIRVYNPTVATFELENGQLSVKASYNAYYSSESELVELTKTVCANEKNENCEKEGGDGNIKEKGSDTGVEQ